MVTEILSGDGPDIIAFNEQFLFTNKYMYNGVLYDLNPIIEKDKQFDINQFNQIILNCGVVGKSRYIIPCAYKLPALYTIKSVPDKEGITN